MKKIILLILILFTVSACQSRMDVTDELKKTDGKIYHLTAPYKNTEITITFSGNRFSGFAGVNNYFGNIEINDNKIVITDIGRTRMGGPANIMKIEEDYIFDFLFCDDPHNYGMYATLQQYLDLINNVKKYPNNYPNVVFDDGWLVLQKDQIFVLGDNRGYSEDSSALGPFNKNKVVGRVDFIIPHGVVPFYYFLKYYTGIDLGI